MTSISSSTTFKVKKTTITKTTGKKIGKGVGAKKKAAQRGTAPPLRGSELNRPEKVIALKELDEEGKKERIVILLRRALGENTVIEKSKPRSASTTRDRSCAAADLAVATKALGIPFVLKKCEVLSTLQRMLFPDGLQSLFNNMSIGSTTGSSLRPSSSSVSLASMDNDSVSGATSVNSGGTDSKRGKTTPPNAREGSLLIIRALCEIVGKPVEPYVVTGFLASALDECGSSVSAVREAAEDTSTALVALASPWSFPCLIFPMLLISLKSTEWRVKFNALERVSQCATTTATHQVNHMLPKLIPEITSQVFDTKAQVGKAAGTALLNICQTCSNPDVLPAIPAVVKAICKPSETFKAVEELMHTTFVAAVDAPTLSILCPVLARALKEKLALRKRSACLVIKNMSRLVESPGAVAPFGPLLVPELQKVANNVQFEEIRDAALSALANLTKALGDAYDAEKADAARKAAMEVENARVEAEQAIIEEERLAVKKKEDAVSKLAAEEKAKFKEAMDAQRELDKIAKEEARELKKQEGLRREKEKLSVKSAKGKCQGCGLKKCRKGCMFYGTLK
mmetsp:Transcript_41901/g.47610  ORF Transcript_41901/g.47610 Transcript_41901/m.47610 type:complete len:570 (-) Transcript_41901:116-1825(-)|eukprot:CAMPEP_0194130732 /NCGR_PEP_ID=MMETSP0152-20130528/1704_1 /TAXON_ID=1049557 /ORGANISM="Thalassiothrix antarctica, Strain L6-D1" /LENGTH=569 /DNA_ID=CAMNT_0038825335 /DNA_START=245 /DNA_END=1954 /DNA_ORIENTATION=+